MIFLFCYVYSIVRNNLDFSFEFDRDRGVLARNPTRSRSEYKGWEALQRIQLSNFIIESTSHYKREEYLELLRAQATTSVVF